ncbi:hypothetical protein [Kutzneria kofuensis]|uniref:hypothetical protein n=1 Tax=Kutzneria kofuensis TaxID=103725 RepID=UPI0031E5CD11
MAGRWAGLEDEYAALERAYPDVKQVGVDRALCQGHLALVQGRHSRALEHFTVAAEHSGNTSEAVVSRGIAAGLTAVRLAQNEPQAAWAIAEPALLTLSGPSDWTRTTGLFPVAVCATATHRPPWPNWHWLAA